MTDNEIIEMLEKASIDDTYKECNTCHFYKSTWCDGDDGICASRLAINALELIERQQATIEQLEAEVDTYVTLSKEMHTKAIKEFWNQRPPQLDNQHGKNLYNQGWNDCISFFAEEYEIFLGIKKRNEEMVGDSNA